VNLFEELIRSSYMGNAMLMFADFSLFKCQSAVSSSILIVPVNGKTLSATYTSFSGSDHTLLCCVVNYCSDSNFSRFLTSPF